MRKPRIRVLLFASVFFVAAAGLSYQLISASMASYLIGNSVTQFSFATGWFLASMGLGSYLSRNVRIHLLETFIIIQGILALVGGFSALAMFFVFSQTDTVYPVFLLLALFIGTAIGLEIPLVLRALQRYHVARLAVSDIFTWDYLGALLVSIAFPLLALPTLGLIRSALFFGFLNLLSAAFVLLLVPGKKRTIYLCVIGIILAIGFLAAGRMTTWIEDRLYQDPIVLTKSTPYQRIVITRWKDDVRLYLDGDLQFSSRDEFRYHESIVHVPIAAMKRDPEHALILGGGDGLVARELLKYSSLKTIDLIDLDKSVTSLFRQRKFLRTINQDSLHSPRVKVTHADAFQWIRMKARRKFYDLIIADLPDPDSLSISKLYSKAFYVHVLRTLRPDGVFITQATSPVFAPDAFAVIRETIRAACIHLRSSKEKCTVREFHAYIPSFGDWGFVMIGRNLPDGRDLRPIRRDVRFLRGKTAASLFAMPQDFLPRERVEVNRLNNQIIVSRYSKSWGRWFD